MSKWLVDSVYQIAPTKVELIRESACFAYVKFESGSGRQVKKENQLFDTFAEAKQYMIDKLENELAEINRTGYLLQERLERLNALEEPHD
jgi:hypothetical protein